MNPNDMPKQGQLNPIQPNMIGPSAGLNDDFLLDDSAETPEAKIHVKGFEDSAPGELPKENENVALIAAAECECEKMQNEVDADAHAALEEFQVAMRDLELLRVRIKDEGGMTATIALECNDLMPGFIDEDNQPIGFFTQHPSRTMLSEALESIEQGENQAKQSLWQKVKELAKKVLEWLGKKFAALADFVKQKDVPPAETFTVTSIAPERLQQIEAKIKPAGKEGEEESGGADLSSGFNLSDAMKKYEAEAAKRFDLRSISAGVVRRASEDEGNAGPMKLFAQTAANNCEVLKTLRSGIHGIHSVRDIELAENFGSIRNRNQQDSLEAAVDAVMKIVNDQTLYMTYKLNCNVLSNEAKVKVEQLSNENVPGLGDSEASEQSGDNTVKLAMNLINAISYEGAFGFKCLLNAKACFQFIEGEYRGVVYDLKDMIKEDLSSVYGEAASYAANILVKELVSKSGMGFRG